METHTQYIAYTTLMEAIAMLNQEYIKNLKRTNVSADPDKTKERIEALWKPAPKEIKDKIEKLAGVVRTTIYRCYHTGNVSAKLVVPMAELLGVDPFYISGETDEQGECTDQLIEDFLLAKGYSKLLKIIKANSKKDARRLAKLEPDPEKQFIPEVIEDASAASAENDPVQVSGDAEPELKTTAKALAAGASTVSPIKTLTPKLQAYIETLAEDDLIVLLKAMLIRSRADEDDAEIATMLKLVLLS
ncbi:hypothetical protein FACS1894171_2080 [Clostridia bacterium]|nr:hypothetical protein FACS1894171_2080 [Clostridia bacterium]